MNLITESFELVKKNQVKRNTKSAKIATIDSQLLELGEGMGLPVDDEDDIVKKLEEQKKSLEEEIKDTEYILDENRDAEELTFSRALEKLTVLLRFLQLMCENHNILN